MSNDLKPRGSRRHKNDRVWLQDSPNQPTVKSVGSASPSRTPDEDTRVKNMHASSIGSQQSAPSAHKLAENETSKTLPSLLLDSAALLQLHDQRRSISDCSSPLIPSIEILEQSKQSTASNRGLRQNSLRTLRHVREEGNPVLPDEDENEEIEHEAPSASPLPNAQKDVRIIFHGREISAYELIGLRVAKTFPGYGRFVGQIVKCDTQTSLYTVVYADGDAEDLTIDETLQILIQDELERADPSQPPPAISLFQRKRETDSLPVSPDTGDLMVAPPRRGQIQVSEREAQFIISLFENHALPRLVHQGWWVQTNDSGRGDARFVSSTGEIFLSPLDVVGHIASNNELLKTCFPPNLHSAIVSLLPREAAHSLASYTETENTHESNASASRKRTASDSSSTEPFDGQRPRQTQMGTLAGATSIRGRMEENMNHTFVGVARQPQATSRLASYRTLGNNGHHLISGDRLSTSESISEARSQPQPELRGYERVLNRDSTLENPFFNRWSSADPALGREHSIPYARRFEDSPGWRERIDVFKSDRQLEAHPHTRIRADGRYMHRFSAQDPVNVRRSLGTPTSFYRDSTGPAFGSQSSPGLTYPQYSTMRTRRGDYSRPSTMSRSSRESASFMASSDTLGAGAAFSMVDVDRLSKSQPSSARADQSRGRSFLHNDSQPPYLQHQPVQLHPPPSSSHNYQSQHGSESQYNSEPVSEARKEHQSTGSANTSRP